jgi:hypothetical protein
MTSKLKASKGKRQKNKKDRSITLICVNKTRNVADKRSCQNWSVKSAHDPKLIVTSLTPVDDPPLATCSLAFRVAERRSIAGMLKVWLLVYG